MQTLESNLSRLRASDPVGVRQLETATSGGDVCVQEARPGMPVWRVDGALECRAQDSAAEGQQLARHFLEWAAQTGARLLVVFGLAPYVLPHLSRFDGSVLPVEPSVQLARSILQRMQARTVSQILGTSDAVVSPTGGTG
jgi:hypothetical protein